MPRTFRWNFFNFQIAPSFISLWRAGYIMATEYIWKMTITSHGVRSNKWRAMKAASVCVCVSCWVHLFIVYLLFGVRGRVLLSIYKVSACVGWCAVHVYMEQSHRIVCSSDSINNGWSTSDSVNYVLFVEHKVAHFLLSLALFWTSLCSSIAVDANKQFND